MYYPGVTREIREAALEMQEIKAIDIVRKARAIRRTNGHKKLQQKRKTNVVISLKDARRNLEHV